MPVKRKTSKTKEVEEVTKETTATSAPRKKRRWLAVLLILILLAVGGLIYYYRGQFIVATINGQPITRLEVITELEKQGGKRVLDNLITKILILQEAKKQNVTVSDEEVDQEYKKIEESSASQGQSLDQILALQGMTKDQLREQIKIRKIVEKIAGKDVEVSDEEIKDYLEKNKDLLPKGTDENTLKEQVKEQLKQQKMNEKMQSWVESLHSGAKINYLRQY